MVMDSLPTPPNEDYPKHSASKRRSAGSKMGKTAHHGTKRSSAHHAHPPSPTHDSHSLADARNKRVWKACERCRMKKTKCDGEFPCKRCKDDGLVCTAGTRKKTEYKQLPKGYAEVLENTQFALIATVHKLYAMVRNGQQWDLGEPELNDRGQPVIHNIASRLGCIRPNSDVDLPVHSVFPEDEAGLAELARQLEEQQSQQHASAPARTDRDSSSELDHSDFDDYRRSAFGSEGGPTLSPQSLTYGDFDMGAEPQQQQQQQQQVVVVPTTSAMAYPSWLSKPDAATVDLTQRYLQQAGAGSSYVDMDLLSQGLLENNFGTLKPHVLSCPNPNVMMGVGDPMMYTGYDPEALRM